MAPRLEIEPLHPGMIPAPYPLEGDEAPAGADAPDAPGRGRKGWALCLSGGGYRAALFHLGAVRRLNECGLLGRLDMISSVSGGSILAAYLGRVLAPWPAAGASVTNWAERVGAPFHGFCRCDIRTPALVRSLRHPWQFVTQGLDATALEEAYHRLLTRDSLAELPPRPRFVICATELLTATLWRFERDGISTWRMRKRKPQVEDTVARAVAASSCFPPLFGPIHPTRGEDRLPDIEIDGRDPIPASQIRLADGGLYDNLGIEPAIKQHRVLLVSDGGAPFDYIRARGMLAQGKRYFEVVAKQVSNLRWQEFYRLRDEGKIVGGYWKLTDAIAGSDGTGGRYSAEFAREVIATIRTDLNTFTPVEAGTLENHGYWQAEATLQKQRLNLGISGPLPPALAPWPELANETFLREALRDRARRLPRNPAAAVRTLWRGRRLPPATQR